MDPDKFVELVVKHPVLFTRFGSSRIQKKKEEAYNAIRKELGDTCSIKQVKKKLDNLKTAVKKKNEMKQTLRSCEEKLLKQIVQTNSFIKIKGDSSDENPGSSKNVSSSTRKRGQSKGNVFSKKEEERNAEDNETELAKAGVRNLRNPASRSTLGAPSTSKIRPQLAEPTTNTTAVFLEELQYNLVLKKLELVKLKLAKEKKKYATKGTQTGRMTTRSNDAAFDADDSDSDYYLKFNN